jgi:hypothetical protein
MKVFAGFPQLPNPISQAHTTTGRHLVLEAIRYHENALCSIPSSQSMLSHLGNYDGSHVAKRTVSVLSSVLNKATLKICLTTS